MRPLPATFHRYVAIGDSSTAGIDDPDPDGAWRGWSRRLAARIARQGHLEYANFAEAGRSTRAIRDEQLAAALALEPDLVTCFSGTNDVIKPGFDLERVLTDMRHMQRSCIAAGAVVLTFTLPDLTPLLPVARLIAPNVRAMNAGVRRVCAETGTLLVDFAAHPLVATDPRLWSDDRIHANSAGHARIADALADALGLPDSNRDWREPLPALAPENPWKRLRLEVRWARRHLVPWIWQGLTRRKSPSPARPRVRGLERVGPG